MSNFFNYLGAIVIFIVVFGLVCIAANNMANSMEKDMQNKRDNCASICLHDKGTFDKVDFGSARTNDVCYCRDAEGNLFTRIM